MTGFLIQGMTAATLAEKLVAVGEAHNVIREIRKLFPGEPTTTLAIEIDATAVQEAIDKEVRDLGVLGEVHRWPVPPMVNISINDLIEGEARVASIAYFQRHADPQRYRNALLKVAALAVKTIKLFDSEREHDQRG